MHRELEQVEISNLTINGLNRLLYLAKLFPSTALDGFCENLIAPLQNLLDSHINDDPMKNNDIEIEQKILIIFEILYQKSTVTEKFIKKLCLLVLNSELRLMVKLLQISFEIF